MDYIYILHLFFCPIQDKSMAGAKAAERKARDLDSSIEVIIAEITPMETKAIRMKNQILQKIHMHLQQTSESHQ
jgi:hypothetical protein